jgi:spermidine/putrescine transport system ATP-binding protein
MAVMSMGKIRQIGTPREIYDRPAERLVANFIGETNFLEGEIVTSHNGRANVRLSTGSMISAGLPSGFAKQGKATIVIRPEHADIVPASEMAPLRGVLENAVYFGTDTHYHIRLEGGTSFIVRQQNSHNGASGFEVGKRVGITLEDNAAQVLRD